MRAIFLGAIILLLSGCKSTNLILSQTETTIRDTTVITPLPFVKPRNASMDLVKNGHFTVDTLVLENSYSKASVWIENDKVRAVLLGKDTVIPVLVKGGRVEKYTSHTVAVREDKGVPKWAWQLIFYLSGLLFLFILCRFIGKKIGVI